MHAAYDIVELAHDAVTIRDTCKPLALSVTNDAEWIVAQVAAAYPGRLIFYLDSTNTLDQLLHEDGRFTGFGLAPERKP